MQFLNLGLWFWKNLDSFETLAKRIGFRESCAELVLCQLSEHSKCQILAKLREAENMGRIPF